MIVCATFFFLFLVHLVIKTRNSVTNLGQTVCIIQFTQSSVATSFDYMNFRKLNVSKAMMLA